MNKKANKIKSVVAIVLLLLLCVCFLCGCTPKEQKKQILNMKYGSAEAIVKQIIITITEVRAL